MKIHRWIKKIRRATALILAGLMIVMTVDISGLEVKAEEKQDNDMVIAASDSEILDVSKLETKSTSFGFGYSDYVVIDNDNVKDFNGKTLTGTTTNGIYISNGVTVDLTIEDLNITKSQDISSCISVGYGATLNLTVKGENTLKATGWGGAGIEVMGQTKATLRITSDSTGILNTSGGYGSSLHGSYGGAGIGGMARITSDINRVYVGNIIIEGGTINAKGGYQAAGIGGTIGESGGNIIITGGTVNATGGSYAAGIGGGSNGNVSSVSIEGGTVTATAGKGAAAIGIGYCTATEAEYVIGLGDISITGGNVTANGNIGYGSLYREECISSGSGTVNISENLYVNVTGEVKIGGTVTSTMKKYTVNVTVYDRQFAADTTAEIKLGNDTLAESAEAKLAYRGKLTIPVSFTTHSLTGKQSLKFTIDGKEYTADIDFVDGTTTYDVTIGELLSVYTVQFTVYDGRFTKDTTADVKRGDTVVAGGVEAKLVHGGRLDISAEFVETNLTGDQTFTLYIDNRKYIATVPFAENTTDYEVTIGTQLYPVTLEFYDSAISKDLQVSSVTVIQNNKTLSAENGDFYAPSTIQYVWYGYGTMLAYLPADSSGSTDISVTASALNSGKVMKKSGQTISTDKNNTILMLDTEELLLSATVEKEYGDSVAVKIESNMEDVTIYYKQSDTEITDGSEIISDNSSKTLSEKTGEITIDGLGEAKSYDIYLIATKEGRANLSNIVKLKVTTVYEAEVTNKDGTVKKYATAKEALLNAPKDSTIKLLSDAIISESIRFPTSYTLDLNGRILESRNSANSEAFCNYDYTITIMDSVGCGVIKGPDRKVLIGNENRGTLIIKGGTFGSEGGWMAIRMYGGKLYVTNGIFKNQVNLYYLDISRNPRPEISGGVFEEGIVERGNTDYYWGSGQSLASGYVYRYLSGDNAGKVTRGKVAENSVEVVSAPDLKGSLTLNSDSLKAGDTLTADFTIGDTGEWVNDSDIGNYTYTWYSVEEKEDKILQSSDSATDLTTDTYTITADDVGKEIYCVVTAEGCSKGVTSATVEVPALPLTGADVTLSAYSFVYDGTAKEPAVTVELAGNTLTYGTDYRLFYLDNKNAGTATVKVEGINKYEGTASTTFTIGKQSVTVSGITAEKIYDGKTEAAFDYSNVKISKKADGDTLTVTATGEFDNADAGADKTVTITGLTLGGASAGNYVLADSRQQTEATGIIKPRAVTLVWSVNTDFTYDGKEHGVTADVSNVVGSDKITLTYENNGTATNTATEVGNYTAKVIDLDNDNYTLEAATNVTYDWKISYLEADDVIFSGTPGINGWYISSGTLISPDGYTISTDKNSWQDSLTISGDGIHTVGYYLKDQNGGITGKKTATVKIDTVTPTGEIKIKDNSFAGILNKITFGYFFKKSVDVSVIGEDVTSGIYTVEYQKVAGVDDYDKDGTWIEADSFTVKSDEKFIVYARITDNAGHRTIINSDGIVVYTDVAAAEVDFTRLSQKDKDTGIALNGNTVVEITKDGDMLEAGNYTVINDRLVFKADYLNTLAIGTYQMTVTYNPLGEIFTTGESKGDEPQTATITLNVKKAALTVSVVPKVTPATYNPLATLGNDFTLSGGIVKAVLDGQEIVIDGTWSWQDADITPTVENNGYMAVFTPSDSENFDSITSIVPVTITKVMPADNDPDAGDTPDVPADNTADSGDVADNAPNAGDSSRLALWLAFLAACVSGLTGTAVYVKKKKAM